MENNEGSLYDQFSGGSDPVYETSKVPFEPRKSDTPHANRDDMSEPYKSFQSKCDNAPTEKVRITGANNEWLRFVLNRSGADYIANQVIALFVRNNITGDNFDTEKARFIAEYNRIDGELAGE